MNNVVTTLAFSFLIGSSSWMGSKFDRIRSGTDKLPEKIHLDI